MKKIILLFIGIMFILSSCKDEKDDLFLMIGKDLEYSFNEMELYDTSTHILYFRTEHNELSEIENATFTFLDKGSTIYSGVFMPGYSSSIPSGPFIMSPPSMYGNYALRIMNWWHTGPDERNSSSMILALNRHGLLHSGISISSSSVEISGTTLTFQFTVTNHDESDLLILDINKTGPQLFHYFTNGLFIYDQNNQKVFTSNIQHQKPEPWNSWKTEWLSLLRSGESKDYTINYTINDPINQGIYYYTFEFPGLAYQVSLDQLFQENGRIWLGDVTTKKKLIVQ